eukprot:GHVU01086832.1.p1 GENE.GHVU01086832.1~~GHVU01086832.1.p1  ORF type:complete len:180 (-),score=24.31 GHVU01086832.1:173-712(-)
MMDLSDRNTPRAAAHIDVHCGLYQPRKQRDRQTDTLTRSRERKHIPFANTVRQGSSSPVCLSSLYARWHTPQERVQEEGAATHPAAAQTIQNHQTTTTTRLEEYIVDRPSEPSRAKGGTAKEKKHRAAIPKVIDREVEMIEAASIHHHLQNVLAELGISYHSVFVSHELLTENDERTGA